MSNTYGAVYYPPLENLPTFDVLVFRNAQDITDYAINSENSLITNTTSGNPYYPTFVDTSSGYRRIRTNDPSYTYDANTNTLSANTSGTAVSANNILIADDDTATTYYLTFASAGVGYKALLYDSITTPLSYQPSTNTLTINNLSAVVAITPSNARSINLNGTPFGNLGNTTSVAFGVSAGPVGAMPNNCFCFGSNAGASLVGGVPFSGVQNLFIGANSGSLVTSGRNNCFLGASAGRKTSTGQYNTQIGAQSQSFPDENFAGSYNTTIGAECHILVDGLTYSTAIGANVVASTSNTVRIGRSADTTIFDGQVTNTIAQPLASDSSTLMPTTAWVQTAITAGTSTSATQVSLRSDDTAGTYYPVFSKTTTPTNNALYIDNAITPLTYNPNTSTLTATNFNGNALTATDATNVALTSDDTNAQYYIPFSKTQSPTSNALYIDDVTSGLTYNPFTSRLFLGTANFTNANILINSSSFNVGQGAGGTTNLIIGNSTPRTIVYTTGGNTILGTLSGTNMTTVTAANNTFIGNSSGLGITSGSQNTFIGSVSGNQASGTGNSNVCVGYQAGDSMITTATENTMIGTQSGSAVSTGTDNVIIGFNAAASLTTGSNNIVIGSGADVTAAAANRIAIGTINETMFLQGQLNYRIGTAITGAVTLPTAGTTLAQFYSFSAGTAYTITLPVPTLAAYLGATVTFKRKTNNTNIITFAAGGGTPFVPIGATAAAATIGLATTVFQITFICDGVNWCSVNQA